jgi:hypothetical protein
VRRRENRDKEDPLKKHLFCSMVAVMVCLASAQPVEGQDKRGGGGLIDWIHRLSGPSMLGPTGSYYWEWETIRLRINVSGRLPVGFKDSTIDDEHSVNMVSLQPTLEIPICGPFEVGAGVALNRFGGKNHDAVYDLSIPVFGQLRFPVDAAENWFLRIGLGGHYFPSFDEEDFGGGVTVKTDGGEITLGAILGLDYRRH